MFYYAAADPSEVAHATITASERALITARRDLRFQDLGVAFFRPETDKEAAERVAWGAAPESSCGLLRLSIARRSRPRFAHRAELAGIVMRCVPDYVWILATLPIARIPATLFHEARHAAQLRTGLDAQLETAALERDANAYAARSLRLLEVP